jgi:hypothetical protein
MLKSYSNLKILYKTLIHCTCLAHGFNRVAETIRSQFPLINTGRKISTQSSNVSGKNPRYILDIYPRYSS